MIGCLIEKEITTPEQYPLSLNALTNACNQKSNREPVLDLDESTVQQTLDQLIKKYLVSQETGYGSRVSKYRHRFCNSAYGTLKFSAQELAIVCELLLRGPQTPGELRTRASRLCPLKDVTESEAVLDALAKREDGPFVKRLPREPGKRESRYRHLFSGNNDDEALTTECTDNGLTDSGSNNIGALAGEQHTEYQDGDASPRAARQGLEQRVAQLEAELTAIKAILVQHGLMESASSGTEAPTDNAP